MRKNGTPSLNAPSATARATVYYLHEGSGYEATGWGDYRDEVSVADGIGVKCDRFDARRATRRAGISALLGGGLGELLGGLAGRDELATVEVTDVPASLRATGVRLLYEVFYPLPNGLRLGARVGYAARDQYVGGPTGGLSVTYDF